MPPLNFGGEPSRSAATRSNCCSPLAPHDLAFIVRRSALPRVETVSGRKRRAEAAGRRGVRGRHPADEFDHQQDGDGTMSAAMAIAGGFVGAGVKRTRRLRSSAGKEASKARRSPGRSQNAPSSAIQDSPSRAMPSRFAQSPGCSTLRCSAAAGPLVSCASTTSCSPP